ncbi:hypothetical protein HDU76_010566, partial [Blyttiomyces sp. JEL0837]
HLRNEDFQRISFPLIRSAAEIGSVKVLRQVVQKGADVNAWDGFPLYASVYNGNLEATLFLLNEAHVDTAYFGFRQRCFCIGLILIEFFALAMFSLLVLLWIVGLITAIKSGTITGSNTSSSSGPTTSSLPINVTLAFTSATALLSATATGTGTGTGTGTLTASANSNSGFTDFSGPGVGFLVQSTDGVTVGELTGMAIPSAIALIIMYKLVPFHRMCLAFGIVCWEQMKRSRARRLARRNNNNEQEA